MTTPDDTTAPVTAEDPTPCPVDHQCEGESTCGCWCELHDVPIAECPTFVLVSSWLTSRDEEIERLRKPGDPGDLPARMAAEMMYHHPTDRTASACTCGALDVFGWGEHLAAAAMSVRWEDAATLAAENARLRTALTESQGNASAYHEHMVAAQGDRDRHRAATQAATQRADLADVEVGRLRAKLAGHKAAFERAWEVHGEICPEAENEQLRADRDALKAAIERVRALDDIYPCGSVIAVPHGTGGWRDVLPVADLRAALAAPESTENTPTAPPVRCWRCPKCDSTQWVAASLTGPVEYGGRAIKQCVPCGHYSNDPVKPETTPDAPKGGED